MNSVLFRNIFRFILLVFVQVFLLRNIGFYNLPTPYFYILFILLLPFETPNFLVFLLAFLIGLTVDIFNDTPGLHAAATTTLALIRIFFISVTVQKDGFDNEPDPSMSTMGFRWFCTYSLVLTLVHHFVLLNLEVFRWSAIPDTLIRVVLSSLFTVFLMLVSEFVFFKKKSRK